MTSKLSPGELDRSDRFIPRSFHCLKTYSRSLFVGDLVAGITVGIVALPLAMAFAIASGVPPQSGIYCAVIAGFLISALGGSKTQIGGPTGAFVVVVAGIVEKHGIDGLCMCTLMAAVMLMVLGLSGFGTAVKYIPRPVVIGFTNGIALLIASTQIKDLFGLSMSSVPSDFIERIKAIVANMGSFSLAATSLSLGSLAFILVRKNVASRIPRSAIVLVIGTLIAVIFHLPVETIQSRFGGIPQELPHLSIPSLRFDLILKLLSPAMTVAMLGAIESLLSAVVADEMSGDKHNPNMELFAQGVANLASPLLGGLPATGAIARTATNIRSGAKTPVAGMIHAITLMVIVLVAAPLVAHIPLCVLAALLMVVAYHMGEWSEIPEILRLSKSSIVVWLITFALTVFADLTVAVEAGMILAALLYIRKVTITSDIAEVTPEMIIAGIDHSLQCNSLPEGVSVFRVHGPFLFGATDKLDIIFDKLERLHPVVILRVRHMTAIDATGLHAIERLAKRLQESGRTLLICGMRNQPAKLMAQARFHQVVGENNILHSLKQAVERARKLY